MRRLFVSQYRLGIVFVDYVMTNNIIFIKSRIFGEYYERVKRKIGLPKINNNIKVILNGEICKAAVKRVCKLFEHYVSKGMCFGNVRL